MAGEQTTALALVRSPYKALQKHVSATGISFKTDKDGNLVPVSRADMDEMISELVVFSDGIDAQVNFRDFGLGDALCAYHKFFGEDELNIKIGEIVQANKRLNSETCKKQMSAARSYGWPKKEDQDAQRQPGLSLAHHQGVQGYNKNPDDLMKRRALLKVAYEEGWTVTQIRTAYQQAKHGPGWTGTKTDEDGSEYGVFKLTTHAYDPKTETANSFAQGIVNDYAQIVIENGQPVLAPSDRLLREVGIYVDPEVAEAEKTATARKGILDKLKIHRNDGVTDEAHAVALQTFKDDFTAKTGQFSNDDLEEAVKNHNKTVKTHEAKISHLKTVKDTKSHAGLLEAGKDDDLEAFKKRVSEYKKATSAETKAEEALLAVIQKKLPEGPDRDTLVNQIHDGTLSMIELAQDEDGKPIPHPTSNAPMTIAEYAVVKAIHVNLIKEAQERGAAQIAKTTEKLQGAEGLADAAKVLAPKTPRKPSAKKPGNGTAKKKKK